MEDEEKRIASTIRLTKRENLTHQAEIFQYGGMYTHGYDTYLKLLKEEDKDDWRYWSGLLETSFFIKSK